MCDVAAAWDQPFRPEAGHAKETLRVDELNVVVDRGYFSSIEILDCGETDITVTLPKPHTSRGDSQGRTSASNLVGSMIWIERNYAHVS
jgi:hypothetical protein